VALELIPLCTIESVLTEPTVVGRGAGVIQENYSVLHASIQGDRLNGRMRGESHWDWMTGPGGVGILRVRAIIETDDGASINVRYEARADITRGIGAEPGYAAPVFATTSPGYLWLNVVQAVGRSSLDGDRIHWDWYQVAETG
jgi:hypothetical protein